MAKLISIRFLDQTHTQLDLESDDVRSWPIYVGKTLSGEIIPASLAIIASIERGLTGSPDPRIRTVRLERPAFRRLLLWQRPGAFVCEFTYRAFSNETPRYVEIEPATALAYLKSIGERLPRVSDAILTEPRKPAACNKPNPGSLVTAAAYQLKKDQQRVSLSAACKLVQVDPKNIRRRYPDVARMVKAMATPDGQVRRGMLDRRSGRIEAEDE